MASSTAVVGSWLEAMHRQRVLLLGGVGVAAVLLLQFHRWYTERRHTSRRGRLKRSSVDGTALHGSSRQQGSERLSGSVTRHPADMAETPTAGRDCDSLLYPFEPLDEDMSATAATSSSCSSSYLSTDCSSLPSISSDTFSLPLPPSASSNSAPPPTREALLGNELPREQMFYGLLNIIATVPSPHEAHLASSHIHHAAAGGGAVDGQPAAQSSSAPTSTVTSPRRGTAHLPPHYQPSSHSSSHHHRPHHQSSTSLSLPSSVASAPTDKLLIQALNAKWQREQRRLARRQRRAARLAGLLDDASTASPTNSSVSSASALGEEDDIEDGVNHSGEFEYESGEEAADTYKGREEFKQPVFLSSLASTTSSSVSSPTHSHHSRSSSISPHSVPSMPRSPQRMIGVPAAHKARVDVHTDIGQRHGRRPAMADDNEVKR